MKGIPADSQLLSNFSPKAPGKDLGKKIGLRKKPVKYVCSPEEKQQGIANCDELTSIFAALPHSSAVPMRGPL